MSWTNENIILSVLNFDQLLAEHDIDRNWERIFSCSTCGKTGFSYAKLLLDSYIEQRYGYRIKTAKN